MAQRASCREGLQSCLAFLTTLLPSANKSEPREKLPFLLRSSLKRGRGLLGVHTRAHCPSAWSLETGRAPLSGQTQRAGARGHPEGWHTLGRL